MRPGRGGDGFWSGVVLGLSLGLVYAACAGPILAGVITVSASQDFTAGRLAVALAYSAGSAVVLYGLMLGGRRLSAPLSRRSGSFQQAMGVVMVAVAVLMAVGNGMGAGVVMTLGADVAPVQGRSQFLGGWRLAGDVGATGGPLLVSVVAAAAPLAVACLVTGGLAVLGTGWVARQVARAERRRTRPGTIAAR